MKKIALLLLLVFSFLKCTNDTPLPNGYDLLDRDNKVGLRPPLTLRPTRTARFWETIPVGAKSTMMLGVGKDAQSFIVFQCRNLIKVDKDATVISAELVVRSNYFIGQDQPFTITAHRVNDDWDEAAVVWENVENSFDPNPIETIMFTPADTTWNRLQFTNLEFMQAWIQDSHESEQTIKGVLLKFDQATSGTIFASSEATVYPPYFEITSQDTSGGLDTTLAYLSHDASLVQNTSGVDEELLENNPTVLHVGDGTGYRSLLQFDLSEIPAEATIHQALLTFYIEHNKVFLPSDSEGVAFTVAARAIVQDETWSDATVILVDSLRSAAVDVAEGSNDTFAFDSTNPVQTMSAIVQRWVSNTLPNYGLMIYPYNQFTDFYEMAFTSGAEDSLLAPTLVLTYSLPAAHRFARP